MIGDTFYFKESKKINVSKQVIWDALRCRRENAVIPVYLIFALLLPSNPLIFLLSGCCTFLIKS